MNWILEIFGILGSNPYFPKAIPALLISSGFSSFLLVRLVSLAKKAGLVDSPSERKTHKRDIPLIGGIAIFLSFVLALPLVPFGLMDLRILILAAGLIMVIGVLDDYSDVRPSTKVFGQLIVATIVVYLGNSVVPAIGDIFDWRDGNQQGFGPLAPLISIIAIVALINAYNMSDGHDGLLAGIFQISALSLIVFCGLEGVWKLQLLLLLLVLSVGIFFFFNVSFIVPRSCQSFLGDAGSMFLGLMIAFAAINLTNEEGDIVRRVQISWILGLPIFDMLAVVFDRIRIRGSVIKADRRHIHHILLERGVTKKMVLIVLLLIHLSLNIVGLLGGLFHFPDWVLFWGLIPALGAYLLLRNYVAQQAKVSR